MNTAETPLIIGLRRFGLFRDSWLEQFCCLRSLLEGYYVADILRISYKTFHQILTVQERHVFLRIFPFFLNFDRVPPLFRQGWGWGNLFRLIDLHTVHEMRDHRSIYHFGGCQNRIMSSTLRRELLKTSTAFVAHVNLRTFLNVMTRVYDYSPVDVQVLVTLHEMVHLPKPIVQRVTPAEIRLFSTQKIW